MQRSELWLQETGGTDRTGDCNVEVPDGDHEENKSRKNRTGLCAWNGCGTFGASAPDNEQLYDSGHYRVAVFRHLRRRSSVDERAAGIRSGWSDERKNS